MTQNEANYCKSIDKLMFLKRLLILAGILLLVSLTALATVLTVTVWEAKGTIARIEQSTASTLLIANKAISDVSANVSGAAIQAGLTLDAVNQQARSQEVYWNQTAKDTSLLVADIRRTVNRIDTETIPQLALSMQQSSNGVAKVTDESAWLLADTRIRLNRTLDETNRGLTGLATLANSPDLQQVPVHLNQMAAKGDKAMGHVETITEDSSKAIKQVTKPGSLLWLGVKLTWDTITKAFTAFKGL